jgi:hypothetical protein
MEDVDARGTRSPSPSGPEPAALPPPTPPLTATEAIKSEPTPAPVRESAPEPAQVPTIADLFDDEPAPERKPEVKTEAAPGDVDVDTRPSSLRGRSPVPFRGGEGSRSRSRSASWSPRPRRVKFEDEVMSRSASGEPSSRKSGSGSGRGGATNIGPTLVPDLPLAWDDALAGFTTLDKCVYERKDMGLSREQDEMMVCDCVYDPGESSRSCAAAWPLVFSAAAQHTTPYAALRVFIILR